MLMALKLMKKTPGRLLYFGDHSNLHGIRYITEKKRHWVCRVFWLVAMAGCAWGLLEMLGGAVRSARDDALSFNPDTSRLRWQTPFPAVSICEKYLYHPTLRKLSKLFPDIMKEFDFSYKKMIAEMMYGENTCGLCSSGCGSQVNCTMDFGHMADVVRLPCSKLIYNCSWQGKPFNCCEYFLPIDVEKGTCFSVNTLQSSLSGSVPMFKSNISTGPGHLSFSIYKELDVFVHGSDDVPWIKGEMDMQFEAADSVEFHFQVIEMSNDNGVKDVDLEIRKCRFPEEFTQTQFSQTYYVFGYSTCVIECETKLAFKRCNCVHHLRDKKYRHLACNHTGLGCLADYAEERKKLTLEENRDLCGHCLPSCEEIELTRVFFLEFELEDPDIDPKVDIFMVNLPNIQYRRNVVRSKLDLVVSIGGLAGLFFGASVLSIVEAIYYLCMRRGAVRE